MRSGLAIGWATVDLDAPAAGWRRRHELPGDPHLGARVAATDVGGLVLMEPNTEGRLAASLARDGEGTAVVYLALDVSPDSLPTAGLVLARPDLGPFGLQSLVVGRSRFGPHVVLVFGPGAAATMRS